MTFLNLSRVNEIFSRAHDLRIAVIGDVMLDLYLSGHVTRISPEAPVPVVHVMEERSALGGAANVAANVSALGTNCYLVGYVGTDFAGSEIRRILEAEHPLTRSRFVEMRDRPTTTKTRVMARKQQVVRFDREDDSDLPNDCVAELETLVREAVRDADAVVLEDYNKGVLIPRLIRVALDTASEMQIPSVVDPKFRRFFDYRGATLFKPNHLELSTALGSPVHPSDQELLIEARARIGCAHLLVTLGEDGMVLSSPDAPHLHIPALAREVYDVSGAGDTVTAYLAVALAAGATVHEAAVLANYAAAIEVGKPGVATVTQDEIRQLVESSSPVNPVSYA